MRRGREHFLRVVPALTDLPSDVREVIEPDYPQESILRLMFIPPQEYYALTQQPAWWRAPFIKHRRTPPRTLVFMADQLVVVESDPGSELRVITIPHSAVVAIRLVAVLLYAYLELSWIEAEQVETITIEFNTVGMGLIEREVDRIRTWITSRSALTGLPPRPAVSLDHLPLKFRNYTRISLLPEETIWAVAYEPRIRRPGKYINPFMSPNRAFVLTDQTLIVITDASSKTHRSPASVYYIEQAFFPRSQVYQVTFDAQPDVSWMKLKLGTAQVHQDLRLPVLPPRSAELQASLADWLPVIHTARA